MRTTVLPFIIFLLFSCSEKHQKLESVRSPISLKQHIKSSIPESLFSEHGLMLEIVKTEIISPDKFFYPNGSCMIHIALVNNGPSAFDWLYFSCGHYLKPTNLDCAHADVYCDVSYPMFIRLQPHDRKVWTYQVALREEAMQTSFRWHVTRSSRILLTDENNKVLDGEEYNIVDEYDLYTKTITIPAKK